ncbi:MAG: hypothetical protein ACFB10_09070 [Salibacteraceae bacterium]
MSIKIKLHHCRCKSSDKAFTLVSFADDHSQAYGQKYFLSEAGEVSHINLLEKPPAHEVLDEVDGYFKAQKTAETPKHISSVDLWRYIADPSPKGFRWYLEAMSFHPDCNNDGLLAPFDLIATEEKAPTPVEVSFNNWKAQSQEEKAATVARFLDRPVKQSHPIVE